MNLPPIEADRRPRTFRDKEGSVWDLTLDLGLCEEIDRADFSLYLPPEKKDGLVLLKGERSDILMILTDTRLLFAVIWVIVRERAIGLATFEELDESARQTAFVRLMNGNAIAEAKEAFVETLGDFFQAAKTALSKSWTTLKMSQERIDSRLMEMDPKVSQMLDRKLDQAMEEFEREIAKV